MIGMSGDFDIVQEEPGESQHQRVFRHMLSFFANRIFGRTNWSLCVAEERNFLEIDSILAALGIPSSNSEKAIAYTVIPGSNGPRWIVPNRPKLVRAAFREWHPYSQIGRIFWAGTRLLARSGGVRYLPGSTQITLPADAGQQLMQATGWSAEIAPPIILVGNPSPMRKVIVFLAD
jgi:hypothetical protein